jgi:hypothetical protein
MADTDDSGRRPASNGAKESSTQNAAQTVPQQPAAREAARPRRRTPSSAWSSLPKEATVNSIGIDSARKKPTPSKAKVPDEGRDPPASSPDARDEGAGLAIPEHIRRRYIQVRTRFHFPDLDPAFQVRATRTTTRSENPQVIRDILEIERARSRGAQLRVRGTQEFRAEAWRQAQLLGIEVRGYEPSELDRAKLARTLAEEQRRASVAGRSPEGSEREHLDAPSGQPSEPDGPHVPKGERETRSDGRAYRGRLIEHGPANYQHDRQAELSYFLKLDTRSGERVLWGKDFERAVKQSLSGVKLGDDISVQNVGQQPVTVVARHRDDEGNVVRREKVAAHRNRWIVERQDFLREREEIARVVRDPNISAQEAIQRHPNLVGTYLELQAAKLAARDSYAHDEDRERFVARFRESVADEIARGERFSVPRIKTPAAREDTRERDSRQRVQERVLS